MKSHRPVPPVPRTVRSLDLLEGLFTLHDRFGHLLEAAREDAIACDDARHRIP